MEFAHFAVFASFVMMVLSHEPIVHLKGIVTPLFHHDLLGPNRVAIDEA